jgi:hypothetical protein
VWAHELVIPDGDHPGADSQCVARAPLYPSCGAAGQIRHSFWPMDAQLFQIDHIDVCPHPDFERTAILPAIQPRRIPRVVFDELLKR